MRFVGNLKNLKDPYCYRKDGVELKSKFFGFVNDSGAIKMGHEGTGMDSGIGSATAGGFGIYAQKYRQCPIQLFLNTGRIGLNLPAMECGSFIGQVYEIARHAQR